jgi:hypothetical protein
MKWFAPFILALGCSSPTIAQRAESVRAPSCTLGPQQTLLGSGASGLQFFPDEPVSLLPAAQGISAYVVAGDSTFRLDGPDLAHLGRPRLALAPTHTTGPSPDRDYAGIAAVVSAGAGLWAFYHGEDHSGSVPECTGGVPGFYASILLAHSQDGGRTLTRLGPVLAGTPANARSMNCAQGDGEPSVLADATGAFLYAYYTDHCDCDRGVQIGLARSANDGQRPAFQKFKAGAFTTAGMGSHDITPVVQAPGAPGADALFPHVSYVREWGQYVMVYEVNAYTEIPSGRAQKSGIYLAFSSDGITWSTGQQLLPILAIPVSGREIAVHPTLVGASDAGSTLTGTLLYGYSPSWPEPPHFMAGRTLTCTR